jgi:Peroxiredoxin
MITLIALLAVLLLLSNYILKNFKPTKESNIISQSTDVASGNNLIKVKAADFTLFDQDGKQVSLSDFRGKIVVLNFWASWCPSCRAEFPEFNELNKELSKDKNVVLLEINLTDGQRETKDTAMKFINDNGYQNMRVLFDVNSDASKKYGINYIPDTFVIDQDGNLIKSITGETTKEVVLDAISGIGD